MPSAIEYLDAFKTSFNTKDASRLDALLDENFTFRNSSKTADEPIRSRSGTLEWAVSGDCTDISDYNVIHDTADIIAGTHSAEGPDWSADVFFFATIVNGKLDEYNVHPIPA